MPSIGRKVSLIDLTLAGPAIVLEDTERGVEVVAWGVEGGGSDVGGHEGVERCEDAVTGQSREDGALCGEADFVG